MTTRATKSCDDTGERQAESFTMQMFGVSESGKTCCLFVEGYQPFFYVRVDSGWGDAERVSLKAQLEQDMGRGFDGAITTV